MTTLKFAAPRDGRPVTKCFDSLCYRDAELVSGSACPVHGLLLSSWCEGCYQRTVQPNLALFLCGDETPDGKCEEQIQSSEPVSVSGPSDPIFSDVELVA